MDCDKSKNLLNKDLLKELHNFRRTKGVTICIIPDSEMPREGNGEVEAEIIIPYISYNFKCI